MPSEDKFDSSIHLKLPRSKLFVDHIDVVVQNEVMHSFTPHEFMILDMVQFRLFERTHNEMNVAFQ